MDLPLQFVAQVVRRHITAHGCGSAEGPKSHNRGRFGQWHLPVGQGQYDVGCRLGVLLEDLEADVVEVVAGQVIALVVLLADEAAVDVRLILGLDALGSGEQAAGRYVDSGRDKGPVVGAAAKSRRLGFQSPRVEVLDEQPLDLFGARGCRCRARKIG